MGDQQSSRKKRRGAATVRAILPPQLARDEKGLLIFPLEEMPKAKEGLFQALEAFVNLGPTIEDLRSFRQQCPGFEPIGIRPGEPLLPQGGLSDALHPLILGLRNLLRVVWRHGVDQYSLASGDQWCLDTLLGLNRSVYEGGLGQYEADPNFQGILSEVALRCVQPFRNRIIYSEIHAQWRTGEFEFITASFFHKAVYQLLRENWRARVCRQCERFFIAGKPPQLYCSTGCYGKAKRKRDLNWWRVEGAARRSQKRAKEQGRQRKGGK
jgi:hypothetical protein